MPGASLAQLVLLGFASLGVITGVRVESCPTVRVSVLGNVTLSTGFSTGVGSVTVISQVPFLEGSALDAAVIVTLPADLAVTFEPSNWTISSGETDHSTSWLTSPPLELTVAESSQLSPTLRSL